MGRVKFCVRSQVAGTLSSGFSEINLGYLGYLQKSFFGKQLALKTIIF